MTTAADELEAIRQLKARYCRFLDAKDVEGWRGVFTTDVVVYLDTAVSTGGADPKTAPPLEGVDNFVPMVMGGLENAATMHHCHTPEITLTSDDEASGEKLLGTTADITKDVLAERPSTSIPSACSES